MRYAAAGLTGLGDPPRTGPKLIYGAATERRVLTLLHDLPADYGYWAGRFLAAALGDVSDDLRFEKGT
jgi:hypothetical protein